MHRRALLLGAVLTVTLLGPGAAAAWADDLSPMPVPTQEPTLAISPPSQQQIDDARSALERLRTAGATQPANPALAQVAGAAADSGRASVASRISAEAWWTVAAGLLVLLVASETTRLGVRRAKHRR